MVEITQARSSKQTFLAGLVASRTVALLATKLRALEVRANPGTSLLQKSDQLTMSHLIFAIDFIHTRIGAHPRL